MGKKKKKHLNGWKAKGNHMDDIIKTGIKIMTLSKYDACNPPSYLPPRLKIAHVSRDVWNLNLHMRTFYNCRQPSLTWHTHIHTHIHTIYCIFFVCMCVNFVPAINS